ncbi:MAG: heme exporter protein CcmB [Rhodothalassiaceae bacterium]
MIRAFLAIVLRDIRLAFAHQGAGGLVLSFYALAILLFPFGIGPDPGTLSALAGGILWIAALLAALLSLERMFQADHEDGSLDALEASGLGAASIALAKAVAHWIALLLPLSLAAPLFGLFLGLPGERAAILTLSLLIGTPALSLIGAAGAALTVAVRRGGALVALLVLPLYIPPLIFGAGAATTTESGLASANLMLLGGISLFSAVFGPLAAGAAIRLAAE